MRLLVYMYYNVDLYMRINGSLCACAGTGFRYLKQAPKGTKFVIEHFTGPPGISPCLLIVNLSFSTLE